MRDKYFAPTLIHDYPYNACSLHLIKVLPYLVYDLPTHYQIVYVRNFIHLLENIRNFVGNCPKSIIISSENFFPKIECPKSKRPKILEINVH